MSKGIALILTLLVFNIIVKSQDTLIIYSISPFSERRELISTNQIKENAFKRGSFCITDDKIEINKLLKEINSYDMISINDDINDDKCIFFSIYHEGKYIDCNIYCYECRLILVDGKYYRFRKKLIRILSKITSKNVEINSTINSKNFKYNCKSG